MPPTRGAAARPSLATWAARVTSPTTATTDEYRIIAPIVGPDDPRRRTDSGIEIKPLYADEHLPENLAERLGEPGEYPYTRGIHRDMYRKQLLTMRQYAGYASAKESNERYRYLLSQGATGLSMAFDRPTTSSNSLHHFYRRDLDPTLSANSLNRRARESPWAAQRRPRSKLGNTFETTVRNHVPYSKLA